MLVTAGGYFSHGSARYFNYKKQYAKMHCEIYTPISEVCNKLDEAELHFRYYRRNSGSIVKWSEIQLENGIFTKKEQEINVGNLDILEMKIFDLQEKVFTVSINGQLLPSFYNAMVKQASGIFETINPNKKKKKF